MKPEKTRTKSQTPTVMTTGCADRPDADSNRKPDAIPNCIAFPDTRHTNFDWSRFLGTDYSVFEVDLGSQD